MTLLLSDDDVRAACDIAAMVKSMESGLLGACGAGFVMPPRANLATSDTFLRVMPAIMSNTGILGLKMFYGSTVRGVGYVVMLCDVETGTVLAVVDGAYLTAARTGAVSGLATKYLARSDARTVGVIGSGLEARTNLVAIAAVRPLEQVRVYSRNDERRGGFAAEMSALLDIEVVPVGSVEAAVDEADLILVATNTGGGGPVAFSGAELVPGQHVVSIGSTNLSLREIDTEVFLRADLVCFDTDPAVVVEESADVVAWSRKLSDGPLPAVVLGDVIKGGGPSRGRDEDVTVFKSVGTAAQDLIGALSVYEAALALGIGRQVPSIAQPRTF